MAPPRPQSPTDHPAHPPAPTTSTRPTATSHQVPISGQSLNPPNASLTGGPAIDRLSTTSSLGAFYDHYADSSQPRTSTSSIPPRQSASSLDPVGLGLASPERGQLPRGISTARRSPSPSQSGESITRSTSWDDNPVVGAELGGGFHEGLHRRWSGRGRNEAPAPSDPRDSSLAPTTPQRQTHSVSFQLASNQDPLTQHSQSINRPSSDYPFDSRYSLGTSAYSVSTHAPLARRDSHPFSLAPSSIHSANSSDDDHNFAPANPHSQHSSFASSTRPVAPRQRTGSDEDDDFDARSPLQPSTSTPPPDRSRPFTLPRHRGLFPSPSPSNTSSRSPGRSPATFGQKLGVSPVYPQGTATSAVTRTSTIGRAAAGLRRMSLRVVNLADTPAEMLIDRKQSSSSPSRRRHPHRRMSVQEDGFVDPITADDKDSHHGEDDDEEDEALPYQRLRGKTLGLFGPDNWFRILCAKVLRWRITEPLILVGILASVVLLMIQSWPNVYEHPRATSGYFHTWIDYALFALFCAFTLEIGGKIVVTGLMVNPPLPYGSPRMTKAGVQGSPLADHPAVRGSNLPAVGALQNLGSSVLSHLGPRSSSYPPREREGAGYLSASRYAAVDSSQTNITTADITSAKLETVTSHLDDPDSTLARLKTGKMRVPTAVPFVQSVRKQRSTYQDAFLRHSWNRIDALAIVSFWICFALAITGQESNHNVYIFRALSVLRATRLLAITEGTTIILSSLKRASPQLVELGFFVMFAMVLFSIIGVQSFRGSYQRSCFWVDPAGQLENVSLSQLCGGFVNSTGGKQGYYDVNGHIASNDAKGYVCQYPTVCMNDQNPDNGVISFDNILAALYNIVIVASANTWTGNMYDMMAAEDFYACLYFIVGVIVLNFWLINMFVAVITTSFGDMREETKHSAFASNKVTSGAGMDHLVPAEPVTHSSRFGRGTYWVRKVYGWSDRLWVSLILVDIVFQAMTTADAPESRTRMLSRLELGFTIALDLEMIIRAVACLPEWRSMFTKPRNQTDLILAVVTTIIQIPVIKNSAAYKWLQIFQIARFYRFVLSWPRLQRLLVKLTGTISGLINMIVFLLLMNLIVAIVSLQLFRGVPDADTDETPEMTYATTYNAFLATYQILSSENWTDVANNVLTNEKGQMQIVIAALLLSGWVLFGYFVLIQLFIAVINENFAIAEEEKRKQQLQQFVDRDQPKDSHISWIVRWNPYNRFRARPKAVAVDAIPSSLVLPMKKAVVRDYMTDYQSSAQEEKEPSSPTKISKLYAQAKRVLRLESEIEAVPMDELTSPTKDRASRAQDLFAPADRGVQYQYEEQVQGTNSERRARQADFITAHPSYDRSLWIFSQRNLLRRACQRLVDPAYGEVRIKGRPSVKRERRLFEFLIFFSIAGSVIVAAIATPVYRHNTLGESGSHRWTWYNLSEVGFSALFFVEFLVKVIADGFIFSPNAYLLSIWNQIDFVVLLTINVNIITTLTDQGNGFTRALKAFRALRLINLSSTMRTTFYNVLIVGATNIWDATFLAVLYVIPYAIWAQKVFSGLLFSCNDTSVTTKAECAGEFASAVIDDWEIMLPRVWQNPQVWSFDNFWKSLLIMCEIISLEGWIDVMESVMPLRGRNLQPFQDASQWNALFFVLYNLVGAVFILTLFVSIIIENFTHRSGMSLLTTEQRQWIDLRRLIMRQQPAKRPKQRPASRWRSWCFDRAVDKHGWWSRIMTFLYLAHVVILMTESTRDATWADKARNGVFLGLTIIYGLDIATKMVGLGLRSWWANGWNRYDFFIVAGTFANTLDVLFGSPNGVSIQLQKLFLVTIAFKLVQKNNSLNQLFKTARASVPSILSIFALWIIMFLVFAIFMTEVFGLTRWGSNETYASNYSTFPKAMVMLALASTGEGWNAFMHDYTVDFPNCTRSSNYLFNDCGTPAGAYALFFIWNVLSMYLMGNLILGAVVENFSGVFQKYGKVTSIDREQMRAYKRVWEDSDGGRKGFLRRGEIVPFFGRLTGVFEVKVWPTRFSIKNLQAGATPSDQPGALPDRARLARELSAIDVVEVRRRKERYNKLFHEAMIESENERGGISFKNMLLMLSHYCLIDDDKALRFEDLIDRRERVEKVMDRVYADRVTTLLQTVVRRRRYLAQRAAAVQASHGVPAIHVVDDEDSQGEQENLQSTPRLDRASALTLDTSFDTFCSGGTASSDRRSDATPPDSPLAQSVASRFGLGLAGAASSPDRSLGGAVSPGSDDESGFLERSGNNFDRHGSWGAGLGASGSGRGGGGGVDGGVSMEDGEGLVEAMMGKWGGAFGGEEED